MPSDNVGKKRLESGDPEIPAELNKREAQDRSSGERSSGPRSPVDSMHVDAPKKQNLGRKHSDR